MDITFSLISGLFLRLAANGLKTESLGKVSSAVVGIWEGVVVHQMSSRASSQLDHYLAYGVRALIDFMVTRDPRKGFMILVWTALGAFASESITPRESLGPRATKRERRTRSTRTRQSHTHSRRPVPNPPPNLPLFPPNLGATPAVSVRKPPSAPSSFLGADSDIALSPIPAPVHPLDLSPTRPPTGLVAHLEKGEGPSGSKPSLPTPPQSGSSDAYGNSRPTTSPHRLSTVQEVSSAAERTPPMPILLTTVTMMKLRTAHLSMRPRFRYRYPTHPPATGSHTPPIPLLRRAHGTTTTP